MALNRDILDIAVVKQAKENLYWLAAKKFTEKNLRFPGKKGWLEDNITRKYQEALAGIRVHPVSREFSQEITGFFNNEDLVHFVFRYRVDPPGNNLQLVCLTARLGENRKMFLTPTIFDLPTANEIYGTLAGERVEKNEKEYNTKELLRMHL
ncbi:MAG: hypothetical protein BGO55_08800 [Sphingobacteriales bacterium 50-39]|nr:hypothetical protein [Sphingobacteriales bacterium]OJW59361.1 MAG: hypothetical protein BGO55_08800 [Sphingobacteriales bacterium 50-39]